MATQYGSTTREGPTEEELRAEQAHAERYLDEIIGHDNGSGGGGKGSRRDSRERHGRSRSRSPRERERTRRGSRERRHHRSDRGNRSRSPRRHSSPPRRHRHRSRSPRGVTPLNLIERRVNLWDIHPKGLEDKTVEEVKQMNIFPSAPMLFQSRPFFRPRAQPFEDASDRPMTQLLLRPAPNLGSSAGFVPLGAPPGTVNAMADLPRQTRRIYVGNLPDGTTEEELTVFFNEQMTKQGASSYESPVISVQLVPEKAYAFLEFRTPEEATAGMAFDGIAFKTNSLKVRRPKDYVPGGSGSSEPPSIYVPGAVATNVADSPNKLFVGNLPIYFNDEQVKGLLVLFGELKSFHLAKDPSTNQSKGFAFCEFVSTEVTDTAILGLNNMQVGEKTLIVQRASIGARNKDNQFGGGFPAGAAGFRPPMFPMPLNLSGVPGGMAPPGLMLPMPNFGQMPMVPGIKPINPAEATTVLQLLNMVTPEELSDDDEYDDIYEDVREECGKYGKVRSLEIPRPIAGEEMPGVGKIFVEFEDKAGCLAAMQALSGRKFASRTVVTSFFPEDKYQSREF